MIADRSERMIAAATWLVEQGFCSVGWAPTADGKAPVRRWKADATDDPALVASLLHGARNALIIPKGRGIVIDIDRLDAWAELEAAGLPPTLTIDSPTLGHGHAYGWVPEHVNMATIPGGFAGGEIRRYSPATETASMVLGPWALRSDGIYTPRPGARTIATLPQSVVDYLIASKRHQDAERSLARGPQDAGWKIADGRHDYLKTRGRWLRGNGLSGERLADELIRLDRDRCNPPLADAPGRGEVEVRRIAAWCDDTIPDDPPGATLNLVSKPTAPSGIDAADLLALDLPPLRMVVPDLLPDGTAVLASPPKVGKSCLVYQIAVEVALGGELFGRRVEPGAVLYLALEDGARRGQNRLRAALNGRTMPGGRLEVRWSAPTIGDGLEEELVAWLDAHPDAAVVAIDTLQRVRQRTNGKRGAYEVDVDDLGRLQALFRDRRVVLLIVHHSRKESGDDFLASVSGTYGITGSADTIIVIRRKRMEAFGTIVATGRDIPEAEVSVRYDGMLWHAAPGSLPEASFERREVYQVIVDHGPIFPAAIAKALDTSRQNVQNMVAALHRSGAVARASGGYVTVDTPLISPVSRMSGGETRDTGDTRAREAANQAPPVDLWTEARRIFADDLVEPEEVDDAIAAAFPGRSA